MWHPSVAAHSPAACDHLVVLWIMMMTITVVIVQIDNIYLLHMYICTYISYNSYLFICLFICRRLCAKQRPLGPPCLHRSGGAARSPTLIVTVIINIMIIVVVVVIMMRLQLLLLLMIIIMIIIVLLMIIVRTPSRPLRSPASRQGRDKGQTGSSQKCRDSLQWTFTGKCGQTVATWDNMSKCSKATCALEAKYDKCRKCALLWWPCLSPPCPEAGELRSQTCVRVWFGVWVRRASNIARHRQSASRNADGLRTLPARELPSLCCTQFLRDAHSSYSSNMCVHSQHEDASEE